MAETTTTDSTTTTSAPTTTTTLAPAPAPTDWRAGLPDDLRAEKSLESFKDVAGLAKSYVETKKMVGAREAKAPGPDAKPEEIAAYRTSLGVPETLEKYTEALKLPEGYDQERTTQALSLFHGMHMPPATAQKLIDWYLENEGQSHHKQQLAWVDETLKLREQWGEMKFNRDMQLAVRAIDKFFPPGTRDWLDATGLGDHPLFVQGMMAIGAQFAEDGMIDGTVVGIPGVGEATARIAELRDLIYKNGDGHPDNKRLTEEMMMLRRRLPGGTKPVLTLG